MPRRRTVGDVMTPRVHIAGPQTPFKLLVRLIEENRVSAIPIVDLQGVPVGIVSESDLLVKERRTELETGADLMHLRRRRALRAKAEGIVAADVMTSPAITVPATTPLPEAARLMQERNVRRLIVVDPRGRIAGIVSRSDLLQVFLRTDEELREEITKVLVPALMLDESRIRVEVLWNVVTIRGEVDRRSDAEILIRLAGEIDGVVTVVDELTYRWDDEAGEPEAALAVARGHKSF